MLQMQIAMSVQEKLEKNYVNAKGELHLPRTLLARGRSWNPWVYS
jgi:hypothetical protein